MLSITLDVMRMDIHTKAMFGQVFLDRFVEFSVVGWLYMFILPNR